MQKNKKILDISPPRQKKDDSKPRAKQTQVRKKKLSLGVFVFGGVAVSGFVILFIIQFFFSSATITFWPQKRIVSSKANVQVSLNHPMVDTLNKLIPGKVFDQEKSGTILYPATGFRTQDTKAQGTIRIFNNKESSQTLIANTRFISEDGKLFRLKARIVIPQKNFQDALVIAEEPGKDYNIGPSNFSLPGLAGTALYTLVYGKSSQSMAGGAQVKIPVVTREDIDLAKQFTLESLFRLAKNELTQQIPSSYSFENINFDERVIEASSLVKEGAEVSQLSFRAKVHVTAFAFQKTDLGGVAKDTIKDLLGSNEIFNERSLKISYLVKNFDVTNHTMLIEAMFESAAYKSIDEHELLVRVQGQKVEYAKQILLGQSELSRFEISFWPFWVHSIPQSPERIRSVVVLD